MLPRQSPHVARFAAFAATAFWAAGTSSCGLHLRPEPEGLGQGDEIVITSSRIADLGVATAWDAIKRCVPQLSWRENGAGEPTRVWRHGRGSLVLNENPMVYVDGVRMDNIRVLGDIPAGQVDRIRILTGLAGTTEYGTNAASGVILVLTQHGT